MTNRLRAYAQLVRLPNVFTALADICLGALAAGTLPGDWPRFLLLLAASACLYSGGMVWNDFFDVDQDRRERPFRPIPSGRVSRRAAACLGTALLASGLALAVWANWTTPSFTIHPVDVAVALVVAILLYDGWLKRTWAGPLGMGLCRFLNVLLGLPWAAISGWGYHLALVVGVYIVGVTWFARTEATTSSKTALTGAAMVMLIALLLALPLPVWFDPGTSSPLFPYLLVGFGFLVGIPVSQAIAQPNPAHVQTAVKRAILGLVVLDAVLATACAGMVGLMILLLLPPALYLGKWIYST